MIECEVCEHQLFEQMFTVTYFVSAYNSSELVDIEVIFCSDDCRHTYEMHNF
jgi:hypothetical protein